MIRPRLAGLSLLLVAGCAGVSTPPPTAGPGELPRTIAVLPLVSPADKDQEAAARVLGRMIYGALSATTYDVLKPQVVEERLVRAGLGDPREVAKTPPAELARLLGVDGLVFGEMTHYERLFLLAYSQVAAGAAIRLVDARNGQTVFERREVVRSHEGGLPINPLSAAITLVQTTLKMRDIELVRAGGDLVRALLDGLPTPPAGAARRPPTLAHVVSDAAGRVVKAGDVVTVIATGEPDAVGAFDMVPLAKDLPLEETQPGVYAGRYAVKPGENAADVYVVARLIDSAGRRSEREDLLGRFAVDTEPPAAPAGLAISLRDGEITITWSPNSESDLAGYRILHSRSALTGFTSVATTETPPYRAGFEHGTYYRIVAVDRAGNESAPSAPLTLPILSSPLSGTLRRDAYLAAENSPYVLEKSVAIEGGATLHVLPGVVVRFSPGAEGILVTDGRVIAKGDERAPIVFASASDNPRAGDYRTAIHVRAQIGQTSVLDGVRIEHASVGLKVERGGLEVLHSAVLGNLQSGVEVAEAASLKVADSLIAGHAAGAAIIVRGFAHVVLRGNRIVDNGWAVMNYSSNQADARRNWWGTPDPPDSLFMGDVDRTEPLSAARSSTSSRCERGGGAAAAEAARRRGSAVTDSSDGASGAGEGCLISFPACHQPPTGSW